MACDHTFYSDCTIGSRIFRIIPPGEISSKTKKSIINYKQHT